MAGGDLREGDLVEYVGPPEVDVATGAVGTVVHLDAPYAYVDWPNTGVGGVRIAALKKVGG